ARLVALARRIAPGRDSPPRRAGAGRHLPRAQPLRGHSGTLAQASALSDDCILSGSCSEPLGAELRDPLLGLEVHVDQPEPIAVAVDPLEVVLGAPVELAVYRYT